MLDVLMSLTNGKKLKVMYTRNLHEGYSSQHLRMDEKPKVIWVETGKNCKLNG